MLKPEDVADYLKQNPAFLDAHLGLQPEATNGEAVTPFHERQMAVLKQRHEIQQELYEEVVDSARNNQALEQTLHDLSQSLLGAARRDLQTASGLLETHFDLAGVRIVTAQEAGRADALGLLGKRVAHGSSICDDRVSSELLGELFDSDQAIGSCAFIPMPEASGSGGVLVLGAADSDRFQPGMGPIYLDRIGELVAAFIGGAGPASGD